MIFSVILNWVMLVLCVAYAIYSYRLLKRYEEIKAEKDELWNDLLSVGHRLDNLSVQLSDAKSERDALAEAYDKLRDSQDNILKTAKKTGPSKKPVNKTTKKPVKKDEDKINDNKTK